MISSRSASPPILPGSIMRCDARSPGAGSRSAGRRSRQGSRRRTRAARSARRRARLPAFQLGPLPFDSCGQLPSRRAEGHYCVGGGREGGCVCLWVLILAAHCQRSPRAQPNYQFQFGRWTYAVDVQQMVPPHHPATPRTLHLLADLLSLCLAASLVRDAAPTHSLTHPPSRACATGPD